MTKRTISLLTTVFYLLLTLVIVPPAEAVLVPITAPSAVLLEGSSANLVYSKGRLLKRAPASTTKVLTAMVALDHLAEDQVITIPKFAESIEPSKIYLREGEKYLVRDLVMAALTSSANDAAEVLASAAGGSRAGFATLMNRKVRSIGANHSHFIRASGLPASGQYSTAYDLALIMRHADRYPFIVKAMKTRTTRIHSLGGRSITLRNHNKMLWRDSREILGKTGWTRRAKHCFAGRIQVGGRKLYVALLGSNSLWGDLKKLVDYQFGLSLGKVKTNDRLWSRKETYEIQTALARAGYAPGDIDGQFGPSTVRAVQAFQRYHGLKPDGIVGKKTMARLKPYSDWEVSDVKSVQQALKKAGYYNGSVDGVFGSRSLNALHKFQRANNLDADGVVGSFTWGKLKAYL